LFENCLNDLQFWNEEKSIVLEVRKSKRHPCQETVDCHHWGRVRITNMCDVSLTGGRLQGTQLPDVGAVVRLSPSFASSSAPQRWVYARICWVSRGEVEEAGVEFLEPVSRVARGWVGEFVRENPAERRSSHRVNSKLHLDVKFRARGRLVEATSVDISRRGARIRLPREMEPGAIADLFVCLPWTMVEVPAQIVRSIPHNRLQHSLRFLGMKEGEKDALETYLDVHTPPVDNSGLKLIQLLNG